MGTSKAVCARKNNRAIKMKLINLAKRTYATYKPIRDLYDRRRVNLQQVFNFSSLPFIDKQWLSQYVNLCDKTAVAAGDLAHIFTTSGTTDSPQFVAYTKQDWEIQTRVLKDSFQKIGITPDDIFYDLIPKTTIFGGYIALYAIEALGATLFPAGIMELSQHTKLITELKPTVLNGLAFFILKLAESLSAEVRKNVRIICLVGEILFDNTRKLVKNCYPNAEIFSGYGISEIGATNECKAHDGFHFDPDLFFLEIKEPDENGIGEVVFTSLFAQAMPLIRFMSGDKGQLLSSPCPCGCLWPRVRIFGRMDGMINIKGKLLDKQLLQKTIYAHNGIVWAHCVYHPNEQSRFEIMYIGDIEENKLHTDIKMQFDLSPILVKYNELPARQWKDKFIEVIQ